MKDFMKLEFFIIFHELGKRQLIIRQDRTEDKIIRTRRQNKKRFVLMVLI